MVLKNYGQQGDVILRKVSKVPEGSKSKKMEQKGYILAAGEVTGHHHCVTALAVSELVRKKPSYQIDMYEKNGKMYLSVSDDTEVSHEEHKSITLSPGVWEASVVREYDPFAEEADRVRRVMD